MQQLRPKQKEEYEETELGHLPENWKVVGFDDAILKKRMKIGKIKQQEYKEIGKYPVIDQSQNYIAGYTDEKDKLYQAFLPVIIFGDHTRIFKFIDFPFVAGADGIKVILPDNRKFDSKFFYYGMLELNIESRGYNRHYPLLRDKKIPFPPLPEQKKIAVVLSAVQKAKEKTEAVIKATKELKKSLTKYLFTYGPVPVGETDSVSLKETEIGLMPEGWEVVRLGNIVKKTEQKDPRKNPKWRFKYIDVSSINRENERIIGYKSYQGKNAPSRAKKLIKNKDVIFATVRPTLKRLAIINEKLDGEICSTAFCVLRAKENIFKPLYLFYGVGRNVFMNELGKIQRGASYPSVKDSDVKNQEIPLPPLHIQRKITEILAAVDEKIETEENKKKALGELFKTLLNNLMTARIRVNHLKVAV